MEVVAIVTALAALQVFWFSYMVGQQRAKHGIQPPAMTGHPDFERMFRIHQNTVEQLVVFLPGLWLFGWYVHALIGATIGAVFIIGRFVYRAGYMKDPKSRLPGFGISALATVTLVLGGLIGAVLDLL